MHYKKISIRAKHCILPFLTSISQGPWNLFRQDILPFQKVDQSAEETWPKRWQMHSQNQRHAKNMFFSKDKNDYMDYGPSLTSPFSHCCLSLPNPSFLISVLGLVLETLLCQSAKCHFQFFLLNCKRASIPVRSGGWNVPNDQRHASATSSDVYLG